MLLLGAIAAATATLLGCLRYGSKRASLAALLLAVGLSLSPLPILAFAPLLGLLMGVQAERQKSYGQIIAAAIAPGLAQSALLLLVAQDPPEELFGQMVGQLESMGLKIPDDSYSLRDLVLLGLQLQPATEFISMLFAGIASYRLAQILGGNRPLALPPAVPLRLWRPWDQLLWVLIAGLLSKMAGQGLIADLGLNLIVGMAVIYLVQGLAIVRFYCWRLGLSRLLETLLYALLAITAGLSVLILTIVGLLDAWFNWRRLGADQKPS